MEVNGKDAVLEPMPADVRGIDSHKLAVDYIIVQRVIPTLTLAYVLSSKYNNQPKFTSF